MSAHTLRWQWEKAIRDDERLHSAEKLVALTLKSRMRSDGQCWPSVEKIAADTRLSERSVQYAIHGRRDRERPGLVGFGYLEIRGRGGRRRDDGVGVANTYQARLPKGEPTVMGETWVNREAVKGAPGVGEGCTPVHTKTSKEDEQKKTLPATVADDDGRGWPVGLGRRKLDDLLAACELVETLETGIDEGTLWAFVVDELAMHDVADFERVIDKLLAKRGRGGVGTPPEPIRDEAAFARHLLHDITAGYE